MALQSSGQISISDITGELPWIIQDVSLAALSTSQFINTASSSRPDGLQPHAMSEWYSYDHSASSGPSLTSWTGSSQTYPDYYDAMILCGNSATVTYYHDGNKMTPEINDRIYTNSSGTATLNARHVLGGWGDVITTNGSGFVTAIMACDSGGGDDPFIKR